MALNYSDVVSIRIIEIIVGEGPYKNLLYDP